MIYKKSFKMIFTIISIALMLPAIQTQAATDTEQPDEQPLEQSTEQSNEPPDAQSSDHLLESEPEQALAVPDEQLDTATENSGEPITLEPESDGLLDLSLEELLNMEVTTASKGASKLSDAPGVMTVVSQDELKRFGGNTLKDILERVPSLISSTTYFADRTTIAARGDQVRLDSGHILILINGRPTREVLQGGVASDVLQTFPVAAIERIEIIRGPGSVLYGSNAFSAVINVITYRDTNFSYAKSIVGAPFSLGEFATTTISKNDFSLIVSGQYLQSAEWDTTYHYTPQGSVTDVPQDIAIPNVGGSAYLGLNYKNFSLSTMFNQWRNAYFYQGTVGANTWRRLFGDVGYTLYVSEKLGWTMDFHGTYTLATMESDDTPFIERQSHDIVGEWTNKFELRDNLRLVVGGLYNQVRGTSMQGSLEVADGKRNGLAFYGQLEYQPFNWLSLIGGVQLNKMEEIDVSILPRGGIIVRPTDSFTIKLLYGQAYRAPSINELTLRETDLWGKPDLRSEWVHSIDAGVAYHGEKISLGANFFTAWQKDIIEVNPNSGGVLGAPPYYDNIGEVIFHGVELEGKYYILRSLFLTGSFLYFASRDGDDFENVTPIANLSAKGGLSYMDGKGISASVFYIFQGELHRTYDARLNPKPDAYHLLHVRGGFDFAQFFQWQKMSAFELLVEVENLLNQEIHLPDKGGVPSETIPVNRGRSIFFGLSGRFDYLQ